MEKQTLLNQWLHEQEIAHIKGWDFSHIRDRYKEEDDLPWDFGNVIKSYLRDTDYLLDMETGGGEFLLSFLSNPELTAAIEGYEPNIKICEERLLPLGIDFKACDGGNKLPFRDNYFDIITNRYGKYDIDELKRVLKSEGLFLTRQVGAENDRELVKLLLGEIDLPYPEAYLNIARQEFTDKGFEIIEEAETYRPIEFYDVGAFVWFARIIDWKFPDFEVERCQENLFKAQKILEKDGVIKGRIHRYYFVAREKMINGIDNYMQAIKNAYAGTDAEFSCLDMQVSKDGNRIAAYLVNNSGARSLNIFEFKDGMIYKEYEFILD